MGGGGFKDVPIRPAFSLDMLNPFGILLTLCVGGGQRFRIRPSGEQGLAASRFICGSWMATVR
jgi:hypothetical protein